MLAFSSTLAGITRAIRGDTVSDLHAWARSVKRPIGALPAICHLLNFSEDTSLADAKRRCERAADIEAKKRAAKYWLHDADRETVAREFLESIAAFETARAEREAA